MSPAALCPAAPSGLGRREECCPGAKGRPMPAARTAQASGPGAGPHFPACFGGGHTPNWICLCGEWGAMFPAAWLPGKGDLLPQRQRLSEGTEQPGLGDPAAPPHGQGSGLVPAAQICHFSQTLARVLCVHIHNMKITDVLGLWAQKLRRLQEKYF